MNKQKVYNIICNYIVRRQMRIEADSVEEAKDKAHYEFLQTNYKNGGVFHYYPILEVEEMYD